MDFAVSAYHKVKLKESEKRDKYLHLTSELGKLWNMKATVEPIAIGAFAAVTKGLVREVNKRTSGDHPNDSSVEISWNTEKSPEDLKRLVITQTPVKYNQLTLV